MKMQEYFMHHFTLVIEFLFKELNEMPDVKALASNIFEYFDRYSELFLSSFIDIYLFLCKGMS